MSAQEFQVATVPSKANQANDVFPSTLSGMRVALRIQCYSIVVVCTLWTFSFLQTQSSAEDASRRERRYHRQVPRSANAVVVELSTNQPGVDQRSL